MGGISPFPAICVLELVLPCKAPISRYYISQKVASLYHFVSVENPACVTSKGIPFANGKEVKKLCFVSLNMAFLVKIPEKELEKFSILRPEKKAFCMNKVFRFVASVQVQKGQT